MNEPFTTPQIPDSTAIHSEVISGYPFGAFGAVSVALTSPRKHFTRQVESLSGPRLMII